MGHAPLNVGRLEKFLLLAIKNEKRSVVRGNVGRLAPVVLLCAIRCDSRFLQTPRAVSYPHRGLRDHAAVGNHSAGMVDQSTGMVDQSTGVVDHSTEWLTSRREWLTTRRSG